MNVTLAKTFLTVLRTKNFQRSAEILNVTQSTVTSRINSLEERVEQKLFNRNRNGVQATEAGFRLRIHAEAMIRVWHEAKQEMALPVSTIERLKIGAEQGLWQGVLEEWIFEIFESGRDVSVQIECDTVEGLNAGLSTGRYDLALLYEARKKPHLELELLFEDSLVLVSTEPRGATEWHPEYTFVNWGKDFDFEHSKITPEGSIPHVTVNHGAWALNWLVRKGGSAYLPIRSIRDRVKREELHVVRGAPVFSRSVWVSYQQKLAETEWLAPALASLRENANRIVQSDQAFRISYSFG
ncbi:MAG: LysR family transcriptional regulator [Pseudomonadota bacterium]